MGALTARRARARPAMLLAITAVGGVAALEVYDWWWIHGSTGERFAIDDAFAAVTLLVTVGLLVLVAAEGRRADREAERRASSHEMLQRENQRLLSRIAEIGGELERAEKLRRVAEEEAHDLAALLSETKDSERRQLGLDLHDRLGHSLVIVKHKVESLLELEPSRRAKHLLGEVHELVSDAIATARSFMTDLSAPMLDYLPLDSAIRCLAEEIFASRGTAVRVEVSGELRFPPGERRILFVLALREVFVNILRHAEASTVDVSIRGEDGGLLVTVTDDGVGFEPPDMSLPDSVERPSFGMRTLAERMVRLQGFATVDSRPGSGTTIVLTVPTPEEPDRPEELEAAT